MRGVNIPELKINDGIRSKELRVIAPDGVQVGVLELKKALIIAEELNLDLVEVSPDSKPPVARLMDYGKYKYELAQKAKESRKNQVKISVKEIQLNQK
jgi:translation initiation factor IF-3